MQQCSYIICTVIAIYLIIVFSDGILVPISTCAMKFLESPIFEENSACVAFNTFRNSFIRSFIGLPPFNDTIHQQSPQVIDLTLVSQWTEEGADYTAYDAAVKAAQAKKAEADYDKTYTAESKMCIRDRAQPSVLPSRQLVRATPSPVGTEMFPKPCPLPM